MSPDLIIPAVTLVAVVVAAVIAFRYRGQIGAANQATNAAAASAEAWKNERDAEKAHRERLEEMLAAAQKEIEILKARVDELDRRPDLRELERLMGRHETEAAARVDRVLAALELVTARATQ